MGTDKIWLLFDGRYRTDEEDAVCYVTCSSLKEAQESADYYGNDTVIVEATKINGVLENFKILN